MGGELALLWLLERRHVLDIDVTVNAPDLDQHSSSVSLEAKLRSYVLKPLSGLLGVYPSAVLSVPLFPWIASSLCQSLSSFCAFCSKSTLLIQIIIMQL